MDLICIRDLEVRYRVGVPDSERASPQRLLLTVEMQHGVSKAAAADNLGDTIDYFAVCQRLLTLGQGRSWKLIETLAEEIASLVLTEFKAAAVMVEVKKFIIPEASHVSVCVKRS
jgi:7,8-dihydroneopterin aldolase/epimerase/oxygenase